MELAKTNSNVALEAASVFDRLPAAILSRTEYLQASALLIEVTDVRRRIKVELDPMVRDAYTTHKSALALRKRASDPLDVAEGRLKAMLVTYRRQQDEKAKQEQERLSREFAAAVKDLTEYHEPPPVFVASSIPRVDGLVAQEKVVTTVIDEEAFIVAAMETPNLRQFLLIDKGALQRFVTSHDGNVSIPGVTITRTETISVRQRKEKG